MLVVGVDPGIKGGWAWVCSSVGSLGNADIWATRSLPLTKEGSIDFLELCSQWETLHPDYVVIEQTLTLPGQGAKQACSQGFNHAVLHCAASYCGMKVVEVAPITWTTWLHKFSKRSKNSKKDTWTSLQSVLPATALQKIPRGKRNGQPNEGIMDAVGIALWGIAMAKKTYEERSKK